MEESNEQTERIRPPLLRLICILTFIGSGAMIVSFFSIALFHPMILEMKDLPEFQVAGMERILITPRWVFLAGTAFYTLSLSGAIFMWHLRKIGFHLYVLAQFALLFLGSFALFPGQLAIGDLLISISFVILYSLHIRNMH